MTARRPDRPVGEHAPVAIAIVCSDKGQHPRTVLGDLDLLDIDLLDNWFLTANQVFGHSEIAHRRAAECVWIDLLDSAPLRANMRCPRCNRHVQWSHANAVDRLKQLHEAGVEQLDISALP